MQPDLPEILDEVQETGFCVVPDMLDPARLARVRKAFGTAVEEMKRRGLVVFDPRLDPNPHNIRVNNLPDMDPVFIELLRDPNALAIARALLGETALVSNFSANVALPGSASMNLHSDQALIVPEPWSECWVLNVIWCLDEVRPDNGGTLYLPGSHRFRRREDVPADIGKALRPFHAPAGAFIVMEGRLWHTSGVNVTKDESRALLFALYGRNFVRQQMNWEALLSDGTKQALDKEMQALLGIGPLGNVYGVDLIMQSGYDLQSAEVL
ncbi:MAG: phytanoyl-CoA dioxygenase family protein [Novosphingobium sp.]|nr:phytanoyl-CoA dioxygenase family protein [Novosphingobium sp.]